MNSIHFLISLLIIAFTLVSCNPSTQSDTFNEVRLESNKEAFSSSEKVDLTLFNETDEVLYLNYCGPTLSYNLETKVNQSWTSYAGGICLAIYVPEFVAVLKPGETKEITFDSLEVGQYRYNLSYKLSLSEADTQEISTKFSVQ